MNEIKLFTDGGSRGNPGPAACGVVLYDASGKILLQKGKFLGHATNNFAEYQGLMLGLLLAKKTCSEKGCMFSG